MPSDPAAPTLFAVYEGERFVRLVDERALLDAALEGAKRVGEGIGAG